MHMTDAILSRSANSYLMPCDKRSHSVTVVPSFTALSGRVLLSFCSAKLRLGTVYTTLRALTLFLDTLSAILLIEPLHRFNVRRDGAALAPATAAKSYGQEGSGS